MRIVNKYMNVLIACEESQRVCIAFRQKGHRAFSCDIQPCSGGHPEWHIQNNVLPLLNGNCTFEDSTGGVHDIVGKWDLIIAHPPCTYLTNACTRAFSLKSRPAFEVCDRWDKRAKAVTFFMQFVLADCDKIAVENPVGYMSTAYRKPEQIINPYQFAESINDKENYVTKRTCLWLKGLPKLKTNELPKPVMEKYYSVYKGGYKSKDWCTYSNNKDRAKQRSKTFPGIAKAMAEQWG